MIDWLARLAEPLNGALFTIGTDTVSSAEFLGFVTGGLCVALTVRRNILNFPVGIANNAFFLVLFTSASLWAASGLQVLYLALGFAGWWQWLKGRADTGTTVVRRSGRTELAWCAVFLVLGTLVLYVILTAAHDAAPFLDAVTTCLSLIAQWLLNTRRIETWHFWIAADCIFIPLYLSQGLVLTAAVYLLFLGLCVAGLRAWTRELTPADTALPADSAAR
ncbi:nicotinamide mononucleotide transporter [Mycolicibacterium boenickei]|uniref:Nicotinamide mononucleotide transporter n=1 Tax=Mycolicibacterium boenickei TaxID=146017 RepID=A0AAX3AA57_9MYCO|nr:nicotinamide riboside transporter PnuC [Mycolicibacterium boenickei]UNC03176.1 nicotinamide mononucleotide transporter [Mycolicibacterium boenickei]